MQSERGAAPEGIPSVPASAQLKVTKLNVKYYLYILQSQKSKKYYIGQTSNIDDRIKRHNNGRNISTKNGIPWKLVYYEIYSTRSEAIKKELFLKSPQGWLTLKTIKEELILRNVAQPG